MLLNVCHLKCEMHFFFLRDNALSDAMALEMRVYLTRGESESAR